MQDAIEKVARAIPGERAAGAIGTMGPGSKAQDQQPCFWIAKAGYGFGPIIPIEVGASFDTANFLTVFNQPGAASTRSNLVVEIDEAQL